MGSTLAVVLRVLALAGAAWYGILYAMTAYVYEPLGIAPREVGLGSGAVLVQATIGLSVLVMLGFLAVLGVFLYTALRPDETREEPWAEMMQAAVGTVLALIFAIGIWIILVPVACGLVALKERSSLEEGKSPGFILGLPPPWPAGVAKPMWIDRPVSGARIPSCVLYLGESGGIAVLFDSDSGQTLRIPASAITLNLQPGLRGCGQGT